MHRQLLFSTFLLFISLAGLTVFRSGSAFEGERIIYPGKGVDDLRIGEPLPKMLPPLIKRQDVTTTSPNGPVTQIRVSSPSFSLAVSLLRIKYNTIADVLRFYGKGETDLKSDKIIIKYPNQGIDFEIDKISERIEAITVYRPILPKFSPQQYKEQLQRR